MIESPMASFFVGDSDADFKLEGIDIPFEKKRFRGMRRPNESFKANIEKAGEFLFWKRGLLDITGDCKVTVEEVLPSPKRRTKFVRPEKTDDVIWEGNITVVKDGKAFGRGEFFARFTDPVTTRNATFNEMFVKMFKDQRDRMRENCT